MNQTRKIAKKFVSKHNIFQTCLFTRYFENKNKISIPLIIRYNKNITCKQNLVHVFKHSCRHYSKHTRIQRRKHTLIKKGRIIDCYKSSMNVTNR